MPEIISSHSNAHVKLVRSLHQKKGRGEEEMFLAEGIHLVGEAIEAGWSLEALVYAPDLLTSEFAHHLVEDQRRKGVRCVGLSCELFTSLAEKDNPQGILAIVRQRQFTLDSFTPSNFTWGAAAVSPQDPGNVGTILRTLEAVGADGLFLLDGGVELFHPTLVRASMGTIFRIPVAHGTFSEFVKWSGKYGFQVVGSSAHSGTDYRKFQRGNRPTILLLGNEQKGLSPDQMAACDLVISMPMRGLASSLNLAVAAGILLYQMMGKD